MLLASQSQRFLSMLIWKESQQGATLRLVQKITMDLDMSVPVPA